MNSQLADQIVEFLNELLDKDRQAISNLMLHHEPCNDDLANHPTVQVSADDDNYSVGIIGILNGLCGVMENGRGPITILVDDETNRVEGVRRTREEE